MFYSIKTQKVRKLICKIQLESHRRCFKLIPEILQLLCSIWSFSTESICYKGSGSHMLAWLDSVWHGASAQRISIPTGLPVRRRVFDRRRVCLESMMFKRDDLGCDYSGQRSGCKTVGKNTFHFPRCVCCERTALVQWRCLQSLSLLSAALLHVSARTLPPALVKNSR